MITTHDATNGLTIAVADVPQTSWIEDTSTSFTVGMWFRKTNTGFTVAAHQADVWAFRVSQTNIQFRVFNATAIVATAGGAINDHQNEWSFALGVWNKSTNQVVIHAVNAANPNGNTFTSAAVPPTRSGGDIKIGLAADAADAGGTALTAWTGDIGPLCIKQGVGTLADAVAIYNARSIMGLAEYVGGAFNGLSDSEIVCFHTGPVQNPDTTVVAGAASGARIGSTIVGGANTNYCWYSKGSGVTGSGQIDYARPNTVTGTMTFKGNNSTVADFFTVKVPGLTTDGTVGNSPTLKRLADSAPVGTIKVLCASNSRATRRTSHAKVSGEPDWHEYPANHAHGLIAARLSVVKGILNYPPFTSTDTGFGFNCPAAPRGSGTRTQFAGDATYGDFARFWTNSTADSALGPGRGLRLTGGSVHSQKVRDTPGSLLTKDRATSIRVYYLKAPGLRGFAWANEESASQNGAGTLTGPSGTVGDLGDADTRTDMHIIDTGAGDSYTAGTRTLVLQGDYTGDASVGDCVSVVAGTGFGSIAEIESISHAGGATTIVLRWAFKIAPISGSTLALGPWSIGYVQYTAPARSAEYAGPEITANAQPAGSIGTVILGYDAWAESVDGFVIGTHGWAGNGYNPQMTAAATGLNGKIIASIGPNATLMFGAYQSTTTAQRKTFADELKAYHPSGEVVWVNDMQHGVNDSTMAQWAEAAQAQSVYPAIVPSNDVLVGTPLEQVGRSLKQNTSHPSIEGYYQHTLAYLGQAADDFTTPPPGGIRSRWFRGRGR